MLSKKNELYEIYGLRYKPFWHTKAFVLGLVVIGFLLFGAIVWLLIRKFKARKQHIRMKAWDVALQELASLGIADEFTIELGNTFYSRLTYILKKYLQERHGLALLGKTDEEVLSFLEMTDFSPQLLDDLRSIFHGCIEIKFARGAALRENIERHLALSFSLIRSSMPSKSKNAKK